MLKPASEIQQVRLSSRPSLASPKRLALHLQLEEAEATLPSEFQLATVP